MTAFYRGLATFGLTMVMWLVLTVAATAEWKKEAYIAGWCYSLDAIKGVTAFMTDGNYPAARALLKKHMESKDCYIAGQPVVPFRPSGIPFTFKTANGDDMSIMKGNIIGRDGELGPEVYIWLPDTELHRFQAGETGA